MKNGRDLEHFVEHLEQVLLGDGNATFVSPEKLVDRTTGKPREFDVVIRIQNKHHVSLIGVECRDRSRKVGVPEIEQFAKKCQDCGVDQGMIVSSKGFAKTALLKAKFENLRCVELEKAAANREGYLIHLPTQITGRRWNVLSSEMEWLGPNGLINDDRDYTVFDPTGKCFSSADLHSIFEAQWKKIVDQMGEAGTFTATLTADLRNLKLKDRQSGAIHDLTEVRDTIKYDVIVKHESVDLLDYVNRISGEVIASVGVVDDYPLGGESHKAFIVQSEKNSLTFSFVPKAGLETKKKTASIFIAQSSQ